MTSEETAKLDARPSHVCRILVEGLFGYFNYDLRPKGPDITRNLLILYGDNGTGKTTLLQMLFHLLHPARKAGHRSFIAKSIFKRFEVELSNGVRVTAERPEGSLVGTFRMAIQGKDGSVTAVDWIADKEASVKGTREGEESESRLMDGLADLKIGLYFLTDDRTIASTREDEEKEEMSLFVTEEGTRLIDFRERFLLEKQFERGISELPRKMLLERAIARASNWVTHQVIAASSKGEEDSNAIYTGIVARLARRTEARSEKRVRPNKTKLISDLRRQAGRSTNYSRYGLIAPTSIEALIESIQSARPKALIAIQDVVKPFIDGLQARLDALRAVHDGVDSFVQLLNSFYKNKKVRFALKTGITISGPTGENLPPSALSSGEKQLLLLFCNLLTAKGQDSIFMIDEPELSLNVKWQRQLTNGLLDLSVGGRTQFILATHSIELLAHHRDSVLKLATQVNG